MNDRGSRLCAGSRSFGHGKCLKRSHRGAETRFMRFLRVSLPLSAALVLGLVMLLVAPASAQAGFDDVPADAYYADAVAWMVEEGIATGGADGHFRPEDPVTRGETAVYLWRLAGKPSARVHSFTDVTVGWQDGAIAWMAEEGISNGVSPARFDPSGTVSRASLSVFLHRLAEEPEAPAHSFFDVPAEDPAISWIAAEEISAGVGPGEFAPERAVLRGELAVFLARFGAVWVVEREPVPEIDTDTPDVAEAPLLAVAPSSPRVGEHVMVSGAGFAPGSVLLTMGDSVAGVVEANASGTFTFDVVVPELDEGPQSMAAVADGDVVASAELVVRPSAPESGSPLLVALVLAVLGSLAYWAWSRRRSSSDPEVVDDAAVESIVFNDGEPARTGVEARVSDVVSVAPIGAGAVEHIDVANGRLWGAGNVEFEEVDHAVVLTYQSSNSSWEMVADLGPGRIDAITVSGSDAIAIGSRLIGDDVGLVRRSTMWHSTDLHSWVAIGLTGDSFAESSFDQMVGAGEALIVHGRNAGGPAIWTGTKLGWRCRKMSGPVDLITTTAHGVMAWGRDSERRTGVVLHSVDGVAWEPTEGLSANLFDSATVLAAVDFDGGLVAAGYDNLRGTAAVWVSDDGSAWHRSPSEFPEGTGIEHLVVVDDMLVAIGAVRATATGQRTTEFGIWTSRDAVDWDPADLDGLTSNGRISGVAVDGTAIAIVGSHAVDGDRESSPAIWRYFGAGLQTTGS